MAIIPTQGLRIDSVITGFEFKPSLGILARDINKLGIDIRSFRVPLTRSIKEVMIPSIQENFDEGGRPPWEPLSDYTIQSRERAGRSGSGPILVRSGKLKRNMTFQSMWTITPTFATIKDLPQRIWYGKVHQAGIGTFSAVVARHEGNVSAALRSVGTGQERRVFIPQRQFVLFQEEDVQAIEYVFGKWLGERAAKANFK